MTRLIRIPDPLLTAFDALLLFFPVWCVVVPLAVDDAPALLLPFGGRFAAKLSAKHLAEFWILLAARQALCSRSGGLVRLCRLLPSRAQAPSVALVAFVLFLGIAQPRPISGDTVPAKLLPVSLLEEGDLDLDEFSGGFATGPPYYLARVKGSLYPAFPLAPGLTALPVYAIARAAAPGWFGSWRGSYTEPGGDHAPANPANVLEQVTAALITAGVAMLVWMILSRELGAGALAVWGTAAVSLGTPLLSTASWGLWMHGPASLFLAFVVLVLQREASSTLALTTAGAATAWALACRPSLGIVVLVLLFWATRANGPRALWFWSGWIVVLSCYTWLNIRVYGHPLGGYAAFMTAFRGDFPPLPVLLTILLSPSRGLLVFSPFLAFGLIGAVCSIARRRRFGSELALLLAAAATIPPVALYGVWSGGYSFGPRLLTEAALLLGLLFPAAAALTASSPRARAGLLLAVAFSIHLHVLGTSRGDGGWTERVFAGRQDLATVWRFEDSQLLWTLR